MRNIFTSGELSTEATVSKMETVQTEGGRAERRNRDYHNLDAIISVGYRVNSAKATCFRQWATSVLRQHLTLGDSLNRQRLDANAAELTVALQLVSKAIQAPQLTADDCRGLLDIVTGYAQTFLLLQSGMPQLPLAAIKRLLPALRATPWPGALPSEVVALVVVRRPLAVGMRMVGVIPIVQDFPFLSVPSITGVPLRPYVRLRLADHNLAHHHPPEGVSRRRKCSRRDGQR
jgi:hypothetical protein